MMQSFPWLDDPKTKRLAAIFPPGTLRFVGGCVRDSLLGKPVRDIDAATTLAPDAVMALLTQANINAIPTGIAHGTITAVADGKSFEITTLRKDMVTDGRHAEVLFTEDWKADAQRRDFTMNALYVSPEGELFDYFGGEADARMGWVKFIGNAHARIEEDYLRILRFFRFYAYYGKNVPDSEALAACSEHTAGISTLSGERIAQEMLKLLAAPVVSITIGLMPADMVRRIFGFNLHNSAQLTQLESVERILGIAPQALLRLCLLLPSEAALTHVAEKWRLSNDMHKQLRGWLAGSAQLQASLDEPAQKKLIRKLGKESMQSLVCLRWAQEPQHELRWRDILTRAEAWDIPDFPVSGGDLIARGMAPGKAMGELLAQLEEAWEEGDYRLDKEALLARIPGS